MTTLFNILTTNRPAGQDAGALLRAAFTGAHMVNAETIAPVGRRLR